MNIITHEVRTAYGDWYKLDKDGHVLQYSNGLNLMNASTEELEKWKITGAVRCNNFGSVVERTTIDQLANEPNERALRFKNGSPKWTLTDIDHGTRRIHGNTKVHGIYMVRKVS